MSEPPPFSGDVWDIVCKRLPDAGVQTLLIGGHAVNYYGFTRATRDIDFMVTDADADTVRRLMVEAGFTNVSVYENVMFFSRPDSPLRVDFLKVDRPTLSSLLARAVEVEYSGGYRVKIPALLDLLAMKLFAARSAGGRRSAIDLSDVAQLIVEHGLDLETQIKPLCDKFGNEVIYREVVSKVQELKTDG